MPAILPNERGEGPLGPGSGGSRTSVIGGVSPASCLVAVRRKEQPGLRKRQVTRWLARARPRAFMWKREPAASRSSDLQERRKHRRGITTLQRRSVVPTSTLRAPSCFYRQLRGASGDTRMGSIPTPLPVIPPRGPFRPGHKEKRDSPP